MGIYAIIYQINWKCCIEIWKQIPLTRSAKIKLNKNKIEIIR